MDNVLNDLFSGFIHPAEQIVPRDREYRQLTHKIRNELDYFQERLNQEDCARFKQLQDLHLNTFAMQEQAAFSYGFRLGAALLAAVYAEPLTR